jgi:hypothetical protein
MGTSTLQRLARCLPFRERLEWAFISADGSINVLKVFAVPSLGRAREGLFSADEDIGAP